MKPYLQSVGQVLTELDASSNGLTPQQASDRLAKYGPNRFAQAKKDSLLKRFLKQIADPMIIMLIAAAIISAALGEITDMIIIIFVVMLNSILGVVQESKAEKAIEALQQMAAATAKVKRNGEVVLIRTEQLVVGDFVLLEAGDAVPADMRLTECASLKAEEAALTGESVPVEKSLNIPQLVHDDVPLSDRCNMAYLGTNIVYGRGAGIITATGMDTEMGHIAGIISQTTEDKTPLQKKLASLSKVLSIAVLGICAFIFVFGMLRHGDFSGENILELFMTAVSLAVAAIPEGLVAVVTVVLSIGVTRMSKRQAIIRRLTAVETLGCTQVICSDKTGTLTQNRMTVTSTFGREAPLATALCLCNDTKRNADGTMIGDPTETALVDYALKHDINKDTLQNEMPRVAEVPFDSDRKLMSTIHQRKDGSIIQYTKGAVDELLACCTKYMAEDGSISPLTAAQITKIKKQNKDMADQALRVLAAAQTEYQAVPTEVSSATVEKDLTFIGLVGMIDPIRPEVKDAVADCRKAGIRVIMITGDHKDTAVAIASQLGILTDPHQALTGSDITRMSDEDLEKNIDKYCVYARVQPEHKVRIVKAWQKRGMITAMTGDGVNDAPALKTADIGVGMGITGTDVTKNVADMVLADDNFATIVHAVEEGRRIYANILKAIAFLLSSNMAEVIALFVATIVDVKLLLPVHLLWVNLITDSIPALALGMESAERDNMSKAPRPASEGIFANGVGGGVIYQGIVIAALTLASYFYGFHYSGADGMTMAFITLSMCEIFHAFNMRSLHASIFKLPDHNKLLYGSMILAFGLTLVAVYSPLNTFFHLEPLQLTEFLSAMGLSIVIIPIVEIVKLFTRKAKKKAA